jgi:subtilisin family serine protease
MSRLRRILPALLLVSLLGALWSPLSSAAEPDPAFAPDQVLIQYREGTDAAQQDRARGRARATPVQSLRPQANGLARLELVALPRGASVQGAIAALQADPNVEFAEPNWIYTRPPITTTALPADRGFNDGGLWGMYGINGNIPVPGCDAGKTCTNPYGSRAADAWANGATGDAAVYVGVIDEGIRWDHPDLNHNVWTNTVDIVGDHDDTDGNGYLDDVHGWDFVNNDNSVYDGSLVYGDGKPAVDNHGTHVAGTIGAEADNFDFDDGGTCPENLEIARPENKCGGLTGVNHNVKMISGKFLGPSGGTLANAVRAVDYMTTLKTGPQKLNIVALNNSWGGGGYSQALHDAIIRAANAEILFIAAAGNDGRNIENRLSYPSAYNTTQGTSTQKAASYDSVIAVAAIDSAGRLASFSNYAANKVDLGAPGVGIWSTVGTPNEFTDTGYANYSGTSMATPHVAGAAALYAAYKLSLNKGQVPALSIRNALLGGVERTDSLAGTTKTRKVATSGRLNITAALTK